MTSETMPLGVVLERRVSDHPWEAMAWRAVAVLPGAAENQESRVLAEGDGWTQFQAGTLDLELHRTETGDYRYNLVNDPPAVYVVLRRDEDASDDPAPFMLTVSPFEAQALLDAEENIVEPVPMPPSVIAWIGEFVERYHVDQPIHKRKRKPYDPRKGGGSDARHAGPVTRGDRDG